MLRAGFGNYLARPLFRERHTPDLSEAEATKLLQDALRVCLRDKPLHLPCLGLPVGHTQQFLGMTKQPWFPVQVCYYRDKQSINKFKLATVTAAGVKITEPFALETEWSYKVLSCQCSHFAQDRRWMPLPPWPLPRHCLVHRLRLGSLVRNPSCAAGFCRSHGERCWRVVTSYTQPADRAFPFASSAVYVQSCCNLPSAPLQQAHSSHCRTVRGALTPWLKAGVSCEGTTLVT